MRFIYLSTTHEKVCFGTMQDTANFFEDFLYNSSKNFNFNAGRGKINKNSSNFNLGEDLFFLRAESGNLTYKIVAYCKSASKVIQNNASSQYSHHFKIDSSTLKIFLKGIDIKYFNDFVFKKGYKARNDFFTSNIDINKGVFTGQSSWRYFGDKNQIINIMQFFNELVFKESNIFSVI